LKLLDRNNITIENSKSKIGLATTGGDTWKVWDRFITYNNQQLFHIGNVCGTCNFFFHKLDITINEKLAPKLLIQKLNEGITKLDKETVEQYSVLFPNDQYEVLLFEFKPKLVFPGDKNDYFSNDLFKTWENDEIENQEEDDDDEENYIDHKKATIEYYRGQDKPIKDEDKIYEFFIPIFQNSQLDEQRIKYYEDLVEAGQKPTVLALSFLDVKCPCFYPTINGIEVKPDYFTHWCFANYLIDGHHKIQAAYRKQKSITILTFLAKELSWKQTDELIKFYQL
jgi:hypothetical protein